MSEDQNPTAIARAFVTARRAAQALPDYPGTPPATLAEAYTIQDAAIAIHGGVIAGWKVGRILPPKDQHFGANRLAGPVFADQIVEATDAPSTARMFAEGIGAVEAEFLLKIGPVDPAQRYDLSTVLDLVTAVHVGIEVASSPFPDINAQGPAATISDFGNNNGLIIGPEISDWRTRAIEQWPVTVTIDGVEVGTGTASAFPDGLAGAVLFLLETLPARGHSLRNGSWISSGAVSGVHRVAPGQHAVARFGDSFAIACDVVAQEPRA